jgi:hypothetical protein
MRGRLVIAIISAALIAGGCSTADRSTPEVPHIFDLNVDSAAAIVPVAPDRVNVLAAAQLRLTLERLLGWHVVTLTEVMARTERGDESLQQWMDALASNTDDIVRAIGLVYGPVGARAFGQLWANHTQFLIDYAEALANHDTAAARKALANLAEYEHDTAALLDRATAGAAPAAAVQQLLENHVAQMTSGLDAAAHGLADRHAQISVDAHSYAIDIGDALASAIAAQQPAAFPGAVDAGSTVLCSLANRQLGSWAMLAGGAADRLWKPTTVAPLRFGLLSIVDDQTGHVGWTALADSGSAFDAHAVAAPDADASAVTDAGDRLTTAVAALGDHATVEQVKALYDAATSLAPALYP